jgi:hypothetical protein
MSTRLYADFNFSLLDDPRFKEESVREELISPLIKAIGYSNSGNIQVIRNHGLKHPFISIGSTRKSITIIPDYLMKVAEKPAWILEAKSPAEAINQTKHAEQAYSYAIHPEIRVNYFALCNGRDFILYNVSEEKPLAHVPMAVMYRHIEFIRELLEPSKIFTIKDFSISKDLGLHVKRVGFSPEESIIILACKPLYLVKYNDNLFSFPAPVGIDGNTYVGSFDFDLETALKLKPILGEKGFSVLLTPVTDSIHQFHFNEEFLLNVRVSLPEKETLIENDKEIYLPLIVKDFITL